MTNERDALISEAAALRKAGDIDASARKLLHAVFVDLDDAVHLAEVIASLTALVGRLDPAETAHPANRIHQLVMRDPVALIDELKVWLNANVEGSELNEITPEQSQDIDTFNARYSEMRLALAKLIDVEEIS